MISPFWSEWYLKLFTSSLLVVYRLLKIIFSRSITVTVIIFGIVLSHSRKSHFKIR